MEIIRKKTPDKFHITHNADGIWFDSLHPPQVQSIIFGNTPERVGVIAPEGISLQNHRNLLARVAEGRYSYDHSLFSSEIGSDSLVRRVYPVSFIERLRGTHTTAFVEKMIGQGLRNDSTLLGYEYLLLCQRARPAFDAAGFQLIKPLGATKKAIYVPYIKGVLLADFVERLKGYKRNTDQIFSLMNDTYDLAKVVLKHWENYFKEIGYEKEEKQDGDRSTLYVVHKENSNKRLGVKADILFEHKRNFGLVSGNWMVPQDKVPDIIQHIKLNHSYLAKEELKRAMVNIDPVFVFVSKKD